MANSSPGRSQSQGSTCPQSHPPPCHTGKCILRRYPHLLLQPLPKPAGEKGVQFSRTFHDLRYFYHLLSEEYPSAKKRITVTIPAALSRFRLVEKNFGPGIRCEKSVNKEGDSLFVYTLNECLPPDRKKLLPQTTASIPICW